MTLNRVWMPSPNYSSRGGTKVRIVCIHTAEGSTTWRSLGNYFASSSVGVSSQVGIDDVTPGEIGEYVSRANKSWATGNANPYVTSVELCGFAAWTRADWLAHPTMLENCRQWVAEECAHFGIPNVRITAAQAAAGASGVCGHVDLSGPGGHWDPGPNLDYDWITGNGPTEEEDLTPDQDKILRETYNLLVSGFAAHDQPPSYLYERLVNGTSEPNPTGFGSLQTLDTLLRENYNLLRSVSQQLDDLAGR